MSRDAARLWRTGPAADIEDLRHQARRQLPRMVFDYIDGAAGDESTARRNRAAFGRLLLRPEILQDVAAVSTATTLFGQPCSAPLVIGPTGLNGAYWKHGDQALARAARAAGIPFVMSTAACATLAEMRPHLGGSRWFQLYMLKDRGLAAALLERVWQAGFEVLELTVDTPVGGRRGRDIRNGFSMPFRWTLGKALDALAHPHWLAQMATGGAPTLKLFAEVVGPTPRGSTITAVMNQQISASFGWADLDWLRGIWPGRLVLKGVGYPEQVRSARAAGVDGVVVSNHGGRQLDGAAASIELLPGVVEAAAGALTVLIDSGFRSGTDVAKALALGAQGVQLGRASLYALAAGGEAGVLRALELLAAELRVAMALTGSCSVDRLRGKADHCPFI